MARADRWHLPQHQWRREQAVQRSGLSRRPLQLGIGSVKGWHYFSGEGAHPGHEVFDARAEIGADVIRASLPVGPNFCEDLVRVAGERGARAHFDSAAFGVPSDLLGPGAEFLWFQTRRLPDIA